MQNLKLMVKDNLSDGASDEAWSLYNQIMDDFLKKTVSEFDKRLRDYLTNNLNNLGYYFNSESEFIEFIKTRVSRLGFEDRRHYYEFYLDFVDSENKGTLIGLYSDEIDITWDGNTVTAIIGGEFKSLLK